MGARSLQRLPRCSWYRSLRSSQGPGDHLPAHSCPATTPTKNGRSLGASEVWWSGRQAAQHPEKTATHWVLIIFRIIGILVSQTMAGRRRRDRYLARVDAMGGRQATSFQPARAAVGGSAKTSVLAFTISPTTAKGRCPIRAQQRLFATRNTLTSRRFVGCLCKVQAGALLSDVSQGAVDVHSHDCSVKPGDKIPVFHRTAYRVPPGRRTRDEHRKDRRPASKSSARS
jgi:hypothetical protein